MYKDTNVHKVATYSAQSPPYSPRRTKVPALTATSQTGIETGDFLATPHSLDLELGLDSLSRQKQKKTGKAKLKRDLILGGNSHHLVGILWNGPRRPSPPDRSEKFSLVE